MPPSRRARRRLVLFTTLLQCSLAAAALDGGPGDEGVIARGQLPGLLAQRVIEVTPAELELQLIDVPLEADPETPLSCKPLPGCAAKALSAAADRELGVWAWDGLGMKRAVPPRVFTTAGYVDLTRGTWVPLEVNLLRDGVEGQGRFAGAQILDDLRLIRLLGQRASPLVALAIGRDAPSTVEGFGGDFSTWSVIDVVQRRVRLELPSSKGEVRAIGPGTRIRIRTYHWALPAQCPGGGPVEQEPGGRALPSFAVEATWDVATGKRVTTLEAWRTDFERGPRRLGPCRLTP